MSMLSVENVEVYYGVINAIKGVSFEVNEGEIIALIGSNGAGKTTILHTITGLISPKSGNIIFENTDISEINSADTPPLSAICHKNIEIKTTKIVKTK